MKSFVIISFIVSSLFVIGIYSGSNDFNFCHLPPDSGYECPSGSENPSSPSGIYYFANFTSGFCEEFPYKGCGGNQNRFDNATICESVCAKQGDANPGFGPGAPFPI
ncbi:hypothetical protein PVAND_008679 [Polypedilum vanderplanki]|uniref:BPTI/Kunitz inhibitor domain-containing protein n=1 Tax=Polypedilum vanderplanki TaxID=319348 RepID=A0A9J6CAD1_POLVA|nr:hypothetical protein PVAND_008679 [Polypedilum vanderplanki]